MTCEDLGQTVLHPAASVPSKFTWTEKRRRKGALSSPFRSKEKLAQHQQQQQQQQHHHHPVGARVISGMLPTLRALAGLTTDPDIHKRGVCLVPLESSTDAASHLQTTLLEAYCREIGLKLLRIPVQILRRAYGRDHKDLDCLLVLGIEADEALYFLESPE